MPGLRGSRGDFGRTGRALTPVEVRGRPALCASVDLSTLTILAITTKAGRRGGASGADAGLRRQGHGNAALPQFETCRTMLKSLCGPSLQKRSRNRQTHGGSTLSSRPACLHPREAT